MSKNKPKLRPKQETYTILRASGKAVQEAYKLSGYKGNDNGKAAYALERRIKSYNLVAPDMLKMGHNVAKLTLKIAEQALKADENHKLTKKEEVCLKEAHEIYREQQRRESPIIARNMNVNISASVGADLVDLSAYIDKGESGEGFAGQVISAEFTKQEPQENDDPW